MVLTLGPAERFASGTQVASYFGLIPSEHSSGGRLAVGADQQAGQCVSAFSAGGSGPDGGAPRGVGTLLSSPGHAQTSRSGQSGGGTQTGGEVVPDVAPGLDVRATVQGGRAGEPESFVVERQNRALDQAARLPEERGVRSTNHGSTNRRDRWRDPASPARLKDTTLVWRVKTLSARAKWRCFKTRRADGEVSAKFA